MTATAPHVLGSLSPSRAADFKACPLQYRLRCIDRLPERPSAAAARGTLVHAVLEALFDLPAAARTPQTAVALLPDSWATMRAAYPELGELFPDDADQAVWLASAADLLRNYFDLEDPSRVEPEAREQRLESVAGDVLLRGVVDRLDVLPDGTLRVVDYKSGRAPELTRELSALFQLKFYALLLLRTRGVVPRVQLLYLTDRASLDYAPDAAELERFEHVVLAIWAAIRDALPTGDFRPNPGRVCTWCDFTAHCPAFGATPPPYTRPAVLTDPRDDPPSPPEGQ